jgi:hypothetical protein
MARASVAFKEKPDCGRVGVAGAAMGDGP